MSPRPTGPQFQLKIAVALFLLFFQFLSHPSSEAAINASCLEALPDSLAPWLVLCGPYTALLLQVWSEDRQPQHHLGGRWNCLNVSQLPTQTY